MLDGLQIKGRYPVKQILCEPGLECCLWDLQKKKQKNQFSDRDFTEEAYSVGVIPVICLNCLEK